MMIPRWEVAEWGYCIVGHYVVMALLENYVIRILHYLWYYVIKSTYCRNIYNNNFDEISQLIDLWVN